MAVLLLLAVVAGGMMFPLLRRCRLELIGESSRAGPREDAGTGVPAAAELATMMMLLLLMAAAVAVLAAVVVVVVVLLLFVLELAKNGCWAVVEESSGLLMLALVE